MKLRFYRKFVDKKKYRIYQASKKDSKSIIKKSLKKFVPRTGRGGGCHRKMEHVPSFYFIWSLRKYIACTQVLSEYVWDMVKAMVQDTGICQRSVEKASSGKKMSKMPILAITRLIDQNNIQHFSKKKKEIIEPTNFSFKWCSFVSQN